MSDVIWERDRQIQQDAYSRWYGERWGAGPVVYPLNATPEQVEAAIKIIEQHFGVELKRLAPRIKMQDAE